MFLHIFLYRLKCLIRDKQVIFWTFLFPILLATMFKMAIPDITTLEKFQPANIAVVNTEEYQNNIAFKSALASVSQSTASSDVMFNTKIVSEVEAKELLKNNSIVGYIIVTDKPSVIVKESGFNQTILEEFISNYLQVTSQYENILDANPSAINNFMSEISNNKSYIKEVSPTTAAPNNSLVYYYALIAMTCLYGGMLGTKEIANIQANQSPQAARVSLAPTNKLKVFACSILAATVIQIGIILALLVYLKFALNVDFGSKFLYIIFTAITSSFVGVSFGAMIGSITQGRETLKMSLIIGLTMLFSFLSGLMWSDIKYIIADKFPIMSYLNPANVISDAFYSLYYYDTYTRFFINIGLLFGFIAIFYLITFCITRREKYASI
jgi:ABC-2 type transport system permease protein